MLENNMELRLRSLQATQLLEPLPVPACLWDLDSQKFVGVNQSFCNLIGYSEMEVVELNWRDLIVPEEIAAAERAIQAGPEMNAVRWHWRRKDGLVVPVTISAREMLFVNDDGTVSETYIALVLSAGDVPTLSAKAAFPEVDDH